MSQYLVTGGAGFIGSHVVKQLVDRGQAVTVLDDLSTGLLKNLEGYLDKINVIQGDIRDAQIVTKAGEKVTHIIHLAALMSVAQSMIDPVPTLDVNAIGTINILKLARAQQVQRLVLSSSCAVYGEPIHGVLAEDDYIEPTSGYGISKLVSERYCQLFSRVYGVPTVCLRYFNVYGPRQVVSSNYGAVIPQFIQTLLAQRVPTIYGTGEQTRDFVYVQDIADATVAAVNLPQDVQSTVINIADGQPVAIKDLLSTIQQLLGSTAEPNFQPWRAGEVKHSVASIKRAQEILNYQPKVSLLEGLKETVNWYKNPA